MAKRITTAFDMKNIQRELNTLPTRFGSIVALAAQQNRDLRHKDAGQVVGETPWARRERVGTWHQADQLQEEARLQDSIDYEFDKEAKKCEP